jgi:hypothetical protein
VDGSPVRTPEYDSESQPRRLRELVQRGKATEPLPPLTGRLDYLDRRRRGCRQLEARRRLRGLAPGPSLASRPQLHTPSESSTGTIPYDHRMKMGLIVMEGGADHVVRIFAPRTR